MQKRQDFNKRFAFFAKNNYIYLQKILQNEG